MSPDPIRDNPASAPSICVLLATHNGGRWLDPQLESIAAQTGVRPRVIASDDRSSDDTVARLQAWQDRLPLEILPACATGFGSAHRNFMRLIRDADPGDAQYVALADQDDIWLPGKLARAVQCLREQRADAYSGNVTAFWPDGRQRLLRKSHAQRAHDYLFGSPGPGCTFVLPRPVFDALRRWVAADFDRLQDIWVHDWLIYAFVRGQGWRWSIDDEPHMLYRQHGRNEIGANRGLQAAGKRWRHVRSGAYRRDILLIADAIGERTPVVQAVRRLSVGDRLWLVARARRLRRQLSEAIILAALILLMPTGARA